MAFLTRRPLRLAALPLALASGCAYEVSGTRGVARPERVRAVRRVAVAPFRYASDWTGLFRAIYARAGLKAPEGEKIEWMEGAFLVRDALAARGYEPVPWPRAPGGEKADDAPDPEGKLPEARLLLLREAGAQAVLLVRGGRRCGDLDSCAARARARLVDAASGETLWKSEARAGTALSLGDEMKAAVRHALEGLPRRSPASAPAGGVPP